MWARVALNRFVGSTLNQLSYLNNTCYGKASLSSLLVQRNRFYSEARSDVILLDSTADRTPYSLTREQVNVITNFNPEKEEKLAELQLKLYLKREQGASLPSEVRLNDFEIMLNLNNNQLSRMLVFIHKRLSEHQKGIKRKQAASESLEALKKERIETEDSWLNYHLYKNSLFPRLYKANINRLYDAHTLAASSFAQKIIIDCSYDSHMDEMRIKHTAKQIVLCHSHNRKDKRPFSIHLCNLETDSRLMFYLQKLNPQMGYDSAVFLHSRSYLEEFDTKKLVYLSPHTFNTVQYNPEDIYILGALVDKSIGLQLSNKKAEKEKIRYASLPLKQYLKWKKGCKSLCIHQCFNTLLHVKNTGDWATALSTNVPERKIYKDDEL